MHTGRHPRRSMRAERTAGVATNPAQWAVIMEGCGGLGLGDV
jgi:hypothetical protein